MSLDNPSSLILSRELFARALRIALEAKSCAFSMEFLASSIFIVIWSVLCFSILTASRGRIDAATGLVPAVSLHLFQLIGGIGS